MDWDNLYNVGTSTSGGVPQSSFNSWSGINSGTGGGGSWGGINTAPGIDPNTGGVIGGDYNVPLPNTDMQAQDEKDAITNSMGGSTKGDIDYLMNLYREGQMGQQQFLDAQKAAQDAETRAIYDRLIGTLNTQEQSLTNRLPIVEGQITSSFNSLLPEYQKAETGALTDLGQQGYNIQATERGQVNKAAQLYNELKSAGQKYSGTSVGDAYGELLGRQTSGVIGEARQYAAQQLQGIDKEIGKVKDFYSSKRTQLQEDLQLALRDVRSQFENELNKIRDAKRFAEEDKAAARTSALADYTNRVAQVRNAYDLERVNLQKWAYEQNTKLSAAKNTAWQRFLAQSLESQLAGQQGIQGMRLQEGMGALKNAYGGNTVPAENYFNQYGFYQAPASPLTGGTNIPTTNTGLTYEQMMGEIQ